MTEEAVQKIISDMVARIATQFNPDKVILFGSYARGGANPDSDVDLLVVMPVEGSRRKKAVQIDLALSDRVLPLDIIVITPEDLDQNQDQIGSVVRPAVTEGKVLYERAV